jgi:hypothetical protein
MPSYSGPQLQFPFICGARAGTALPASWAAIRIAALGFGCAGGFAFPLAGSVQSNYNGWAHIYS